MRKFVSINNFKGLHTVEGVLGAPEGSFEIADNVDFPDTTKAQSRPPLALNGGPVLPGTPVWLASGVQIYGGVATSRTVAAAAVDNNAANPTMLVDLINNSTIPIISSVPVFGTSLPMRSARFGQNLYLTSNNGVIRVEFASGSAVARWAGMAQAHPLLWYPTANTTTGAWLQNGYATAYRVVYAYHMRDGSILRSAPSSSFNYPNTSGSSVWLSHSVRHVVAANSPLADAFDPTDSETVDVELYRSPQVPGTNGTDEMQLCYKRKLTAAEKAGSSAITIDDKCPDAALGAYLYTNANTGDTIIGGVSAGLAGRNDEPPRCTDLATYANRLFFSNCRQKHSLTFSLIATGTSGALLKTGDRINVDGTTLTAGTHFTVFTAGTISQNIAQTAYSLAFAVNANVQNVKAEYIGNPLSAQSVGLIRLTARSHSAAGYSVLITSGGSGASFVPNLDSPAYSSQEDRPNWLAWSKEGQPDAVPPVNYTQVGRGVIERIIPSRDALYIMATDGLWRLTGNTDDNFSVEMVDSTFRLAESSLVTAIGEKVYVWTTHGISVITTSGVIPIDAPIKNVVRRKFLNGLSGGFAVSDRSTDRVMFFMPNLHSDAMAAKKTSSTALVFNANSGLWSRYVYPMSMQISAAMEVPELSYYNLQFSLADDGSGTSQYDDTSDEWLAFSNPHSWFESGSDYYDRGPTAVGAMAIERSTQAMAGYIDARGEGTSQDKAVKVVLRWTSHSGDPLAMAQWHDAVLFLSDDSSFGGVKGSGQLDVSFETDKDGPTSQIGYIPVDAGTSPVRVVVPSEAARGQKMTITVRNSWIHRVAGLGVQWAGPFSMSGIGLTYDVDGIEVSR